MDFDPRHMAKNMNLERFHKRTKAVWSDYRDFLFKQNVFALATGVIIGGTMGSFVSKINSDLIMPVVNLCLRNQEWANAGITISTYIGTDGKMHDNKLLFGDLLFGLLNLAVIGLVCYLITKMMVTPGAPTQACPYCQEQIVATATKCKFCCSEIHPTPPANTSEA
jgi:large conductance mechanosensitive channel protein